MPEQVIPFAQRHPQYDKFLSKWTRCRDAADGTDAVKEKGELYLPRLHGQTTAEYNAYKKRALYVNVTARTLNSLVGLVTHRAPDLIYPPAMEAHFKDVDNRGTEFPQLFRWCVNDVLLVGRIGLFVDFPVEGGRGYINAYAAENIINWGIDNRTYKLNMVLLQEHLYEPASTILEGQEFSLTSVLRIRALFLDKNGVYRVRVYKQKARGGNPSTISLEFEEEFTPNINGRPLDFIPFTFITPFGIDTALYKPPMLDIADINLSHYRSSADLEHGRHFTALPVPVVSGLDSDKELRIGSQTAWILPDPAAKAYYLEFEGKGLESLEKALKEKMEQMALFSTRLMDTSTRGSESPDSVKMRHASDAATLVDIARAVENGLTRSFTILKDLEGHDGELVIRLNKNFLAMKLTAAELRELTKSYLEGAIDQQTYLWNLQRGDLTPPTGETNAA